MSLAELHDVHATALEKNHPSWAELLLLSLSAGNYVVPPRPPPTAGEPLTLVSPMGNLYLTVDDERVAGQLLHDVYDEWDDHRQPTVSWCFSFVMLLMFMMILQSTMTVPADGGAGAGGAGGGASPSPAVDPSAAGGAGSAAVGLLAGFSLVVMWLFSKLFLVVLPLVMLMRLATRAQVRRGEGGHIRINAVALGPVTAAAVSACVHAQYAAHMSRAWHADCWFCQLLWNSCPTRMSSSVLFCLCRSRQPRRLRQLQWALCPGWMGPHVPQLRIGTTPWSHSSPGWQQLEQQHRHDRCRRLPLLLAPRRQEQQQGPAVAALMWLMLRCSRGHSKCSGRHSAGWVGTPSSGPLQVAAGAAGLRKGRSSQRSRNSRRRWQRHSAWRVCKH